MTAKWIAIGAAGAIGVGLAVYAFFVEPLMLRLNRIELRFPDLPQGLDGLTICHLSDIHSVWFGGIEEKLVRMLSEIDADVCAITGDIGYVPIGIEVLRRAHEALRPRLGAFFVPGNGDYKVVADIEEITRGLAGIGIRPLMNDSALVSDGDQRLCVIGVDDPYRGYDDLARALSNATGDGFKLLLAHSPDIIVDLSDDSADLVLAGHTHGGQVRIPFVGAIWLNLRHRLGISRGHYGPEALSRMLGRNLPHTHLYVSGGIGGSWFRARFMCPPEIALITLRRANPEPFPV